MADETDLPKEISAAGRYASMEQDRQGFLTRARECAALTIPSVMPPQGFSSTTKLPTPYQSLGARGARTLASKLLLSLFPGIPFFNYKLDDATLEKLGSNRGDTEKALASRERAVAHELDISVFRPAAFLSLLHLIITGNAIVRVPLGRRTALRFSGWISLSHVGMPLEISSNLSSRRPLILHLSRRKFALN